MRFILFTLSLVVIVGSFFYYAYALTNGVVFIIFAIVLILIILKVRGNTRSSATTLGVESTPSVYPQTRNAILISFFLIPLAAAFYILFTHQTTAALRSSWEVVPPYFFLFYGASVFVIFLIGRSTASPPPTIAEVSMEESPSAGGGVSEATIGNRRGPPAEHGDLPRHRSVSPDGEAVERQTIPLIALSILTFLTLSISLFIFPLGAGFDPFIHQAAEKVIAATGAITPKSPYYIGQYVLVVFLSKILGISVVWIDKLLVPLLAALLLPLSIVSWIRKAVRSATFSSADDSETVVANAGAEGLILQADTSERPPVMKPWSDRHFKTVERVAGREIAERATLISFLLLPFLLAPFTTTTPYSLALLFLIVLIFHVTRNTQHITSLLLASTIFLIHPIVGIPAFIFLIVQYVKKFQNKLLRATCYVLCALAIPLAFLLAAQFSSQIHITFAPQNFLPWLRSIEWSGIYRENRFNAPLDLIYFYGFNIKNIFWFFVITAIVRLLRSTRNDKTRGVTPGGGPPSSPSSEAMRSDGGAGRQDPEQSVPEWRQKSYLLTFLILLTSYVLMSGFLSFNFLIGYEQADYAKRILNIAYLFLIPLFLIGIHWWLARIPRLAAVILLTLAITASLFLTYPQKVDSYAVNHAFNTSQTDIDAVRWIEADARGEDYIVLANQAVSAAAIRELGFKKYFKLITNYQLPITNVFFYPIPTGSPLYKFYLEMVYKNASTETLREAINSVSAQRGYFVLNRYWNDFDRIFAEAQQNLQLLHSINNSIFIFTVTP